jgi:hypothetical protein
LTLEAGKKSFTTLTASALIRGTFTDPDDGNAYLIIGNQIKQFQGGSTDQTYTWKSKEFVPYQNLQAWVLLKIDAEAFPVTVKVYGDGVLFYTGTIALAGLNILFLEAMSMLLAALLI